MTNITGKIYQETNDDGTENRFPKTVVPAVIGLSQYLQDQFNTLSDLYMPKEGESESKTGQEITYRKSEATINAKTVTIDRIYGKTLVWNQRANCTSGLTARYGSVTSRSVNGFVGSSPASSEDKFFLIGSAFYDNTHKYYLGFDYKSNLAYTLQDMHIGEIPMAATTIFVHYSKIAPRTSGSYAGVYWYLYATTSETWNIEVKNLSIVDLTLMFGAGSEPTVDEFERVYGGGNYPKNLGIMISNSAKYIEIIVWDGVR